GAGRRAGRRARRGARRGGRGPCGRARCGAAPWWSPPRGAARHSPAVRALYRRVIAKHPKGKAVAVGHAMRKLLHLVFALWKSGRPFDPQHYPWEQAAPAAAAPPETGPQPAAPERAPADQAAGHTPESKPAAEVVTAACVPTL